VTRFLLERREQGGIQTIPPDAATIPARLRVSLRIERRLMLRTCFRRPVVGTGEVTASSNTAKQRFADTLLRAADVAKMVPQIGEPK
jgi:hypothetical protein